MTKIDKLIEHFKSEPRDFTWDELKRLLNFYGYYEYKTNWKSGGSRRKFRNDSNRIISLHEPHPKKIVKSYVIKLVRNQLNI